MIRPETDDIIAFLNSLVALDKYAMAELLAIRVPCNRAMAEHPSMQVAGHGPDCTFIAPGTWRVGILGLLNGFCGTIEGGSKDQWGPIAAVYDEDFKLARFERTDATETKS